MDLDLFQCAAIKIIYHDLCSDFHDNADDVVIKIFREFPFPSQKSKNKKYIVRLFNESFDPVSASTKVLVKILIDRKALGFSEKFCDPLSKECIKRKLCGDNPPVEFSLPLTFYQSQLLKSTRHFCLEYLKNHMTTDRELLPYFFLSMFDEQTGSIRSSPAWDDLVQSSDAANCFFNALFKFLHHQHTLHLDAVKAELLTLLFKKIGNSDWNCPKVEISNCIINETLFELEQIIKQKQLIFKNCYNLKVGTTDEEISSYVHSDILNYETRKFSFNKIVRLIPSHLR